MIGNFFLQLHQIGCRNEPALHSNVSNTKSVLQVDNLPN